MLAEVVAVLTPDQVAREEQGAVARVQQLAVLLHRALQILAGVVAAVTTTALVQADQG